MPAEAEAVVMDYASNLAFPVGQRRLARLLAIFLTIHGTVFGLWVLLVERLDINHGTLANSGASSIETWCYEWIGSTLPELTIALTSIGAAGAIWFMLQRTNSHMLGFGLSSLFASGIYFILELVSRYYLSIRPPMLFLTLSGVSHLQYCFDLWDVADIVVRTSPLWAVGWVLIINRT